MEARAGTAAEVGMFAAAFVSSSSEGSASGGGGGGVTQQQQQEQQRLQQHHLLHQELKFTTVDGRGQQPAVAERVGGAAAGSGAMAAAEIDFDFKILANYLAEEGQFGEKLT